MLKRYGVSQELKQENKAAGKHRKSIQCLKRVFSLEPAPALFNTYALFCQEAPPSLHTYQAQAFHPKSQGLAPANMALWSLNKYWLNISEEVVLVLGSRNESDK